MSMRDSFQLVTDVCDSIDRSLLHSTRNRSSLTASERQLCAMRELDMQVFNGGFFGYYFNTGGEHAEDAQSGFRALGLASHADLVARAIEIARHEMSSPSLLAGANEEPRNWAEAYKNIREASDLKSLDVEWYGLDTTANVVEAQATYIRSHPKEFPHGGEIEY